MATKKIFPLLLLLLLIKDFLYSSPLLGIPFVKNEGQIKDKNVIFHAKTFSGAFFILKDGKIVHSLSKKNLKTDNTTTIFESFNNIKKPEFTQADKSNLKVNFFYGDKKNWLSNLATYRVVDYGNIYDGIDLKLLSKQNNVEKLFVVSPFANPNQIDISLQGTKDLRISFDGKLTASTKLGDIAFTKPVAWTEDGDKVDFIEVAYKITKNGYGFELGNYDRSKTLVIDPLLGSTFIGGSNADEILDLDINASDTVYGVGHTLSSIDSTLSLTPGRTYTANKDGFIVVLNSDLNQSSYMTYIGGSGNDEIRKIKINSTDGTVLVTGITESSDFPTSSDGNDTSYNGNVDGFVTQLNSTLSTISHSTFIGGGGEDVLSGIDIDSNGYVYVTGYTTSSENSLPIVSGEGNDTTQNGNYDSVTFKLDSTLANVINGTFLGTLASDGSRIVKVISGSVYIGGFTLSSTFPVSNTSGSGIEGFVAQFDTNLTDCNVTLINGNGDDEIYGLDYNSSGGIVVAGTSNSTNLTGAGTIGGNKDGFIASFPFDLSGGSAQISYLGGSDNDEIRDLVIDRDSNLTFVTGYTTSSSSSTLDFNITNSIYQSTNNGNGDVFVSKYKNGIKDLNGSTFIGGTSLDLGHSIKLDSSGNVYVGGVTASLDFPVSNLTGSILASYSSDDDGFIFKISSDLAYDYGIISTSATSSNGDLITNSDYIHFKNVILSEESDEIIITVANSGTKSIYISSIDLNDTSKGFNLNYRSTDTNPCEVYSSFTVNANETCTFGVILTPVKLNDVNVTITINNDTNVSDHNITASGIGVLSGVQNIYVTPTLIDLQAIENTAVNNHIDYNITIVNFGNTNLIVSDINSSDHNFTVRTADTGLTCLTTTPTISGDTNCTFAVRFAPSEAGDFNGTIYIKSNDPDSPIKTVQVNGIGVTGLNADASILEYQNVTSGSTKDLNITITNSSATNVTVNAIALNSGTNYTYTAAFGDCSALPAVISQNEECNLTVRFSPSTTGTLTDTLIINSNDTATPELNISLTGTGVSPNSALIDTNLTVVNLSTVNIGTTGYLNDIKISNTGLADLILSGFSVNGSTIFSYDVTKGSKPCNSTTPTIVSGDYCTFGVSFTPANSTDYEHNLTISSNSLSGDLNISLVGTGVLNNDSGLTLQSFSVSDSYGIAPLATTFSVSVTGGSGSYSYYWDFDDTTTSTLQSPTKTFSTVGDYNVSVRVSDSSNPNNYIVIESNVSVVTQANYSPVSISGFSMTPSGGAAPLTTSFSLTPTGGSGSYTYLWSFGDGYTSTTQNPSHTYTSEGTYSVTVTVTDAADSTNYTTASGSVVGFNGGGLNISLSSSSSSGTPPFTATFSGTVTGGNIPYYLTWDFGDGEGTSATIYASDFSQSHTFTKSGGFDVTITATDGTSGGSSSSRVQSALLITVKEPVSAKANTKTFSGDGDYCFIATAAYGSLLEPEVTTLRLFRDRYLRTNSLGRFFIKTYYTYSPPIANFISERDSLRAVVRGVLRPVIYAVKYKKATFILFLLLLTLLGTLKYNPKTKIQ